MISSYMNQNLIKLELETVENMQLDDEERMKPKIIQAIKFSVLEELVDLVIITEDVKNRKRLLTDIWNREKRDTTGIGRGVAIPHVRSKTMDGTYVVIARSTPGLPFESRDEMPCHAFFGVFGNYFNPRLYLEIYKDIVQISQYDDFMKRFLKAESVQDIFVLIQEFE
ncbi:MAG: PTS sugar transporter subunit IIA [Candidatus Coatesbacteria bacterium]|nr:PTS sugar transporter subunit IIA [Candidatus Coatesbacteria bacterium]